MAVRTFDQLYNLGKAELLLRRPDLVVNEGDVTDMLLAMAAAMADHNEELTAEEFKATFLDTAEGDELTTLADDHFDVQRQLAIQAQVVVDFTHTPGPTGTIPAGTIVATQVQADGVAIQFTTDSDLVFGGGDATLSVNATADEAGTAGNVGAGEIDRIISTGLFDSFTVTNLAAAGGGNEEEDDAQLRERVRNQPLTFRRATLAALEQGALTVPSVRVAKAVEGAGGAVSVFVSDEDGNSTLQMVSDVELALEEFRAAGIDVSVVGGAILVVAITVTLTLGPGAVAAVLEQPVIDAISAAVEKLRHGETLFDTMVTTAARNVEPDLILDVDYTAGDIVPAANELIRAGVITVL